MSSNFDFLRNFDNDLHYLACIIEDEIYDSKLTNTMKEDIYNKICEIMETRNISNYWNILLNNAINNN